MFPFWNIAEKIQDWVRGAFEAIYPTINDFWNMLYGTKINPFETPNGLATLFMSLSIIFIILFGVTHLLRNVGAYTQKRMIKKTFIILLSILSVILMWNLVKADEKEVTFNLSLVYFRWDVSPDESNLNVTSESLWYAWVTVDNAFSQDPFADEVLAWAGSNGRSNITFSPFHALWIRWSIKYTPQFALAVWVLPKQVGFNDIGKSGVYFSQSDMIGKTLPSGVSKWTSICPSPVKWDEKSWTAAFGTLLPDETNIRFVEGKKLTNNDTGYKGIGCLEKITPYRKDLIFLNEASGKKTIDFEVVPMYYPLILLAQYGNFDIAKQQDVLMQDFLFATEVSDSSETATEADKEKNQKFGELYDKLSAIGAFDSGNNVGFNVWKLSSVNKFNQWKTEDIFSVDLLITEVNSKLNAIKTNIEQINQNEASLERADSSTSPAVIEAYKKAIDNARQTMVDTYNTLNDPKNNLIDIFKGYLGNIITVNRMKTASAASLEPELTAMINGIENSKNLFYSDKELKFQEIYKEFIQFGVDYKVDAFANVKSADDLFRAIDNEKDVYGKNLFSGTEIITKLICHDEETKKKMNIALKSAGAAEITDEVVKCTGGNWVVVDKEKLAGVLDSIVSVQYKKDKLTSVNLISYYGKILKGSLDNKKIGRINDIQYDANSTLPTKIGNYTLVSPLHYYKKLIDWDYSGLPTFINLKNIDGKVYMPEWVYDLKIGGVKSWYKDLDAVNGEKFGNDMSVFGIPLLSSILFVALFILNTFLLLWAFIFILSYFVILIKD